MHAVKLRRVVQVSAAVGLSLVHVGVHARSLCRYKSPHSAPTDPIATSVSDPLSSDGNPAGDTVIYTLDNMGNRKTEPMRRRGIPCNLIAASAIRSSACICWNLLVIVTPYRKGKVLHFRSEIANDKDATGINI